MLQTFPFVNYFPGVNISAAVACVLALVIRVLPSLLFRLKLSFCLMKYASKGVVSKKSPRGDPHGPQVFHRHLQSLHFKLYLSSTYMFYSIFA